MHHFSFEIKKKFWEGGRTPPPLCPHNSLPLANTYGSATARDAITRSRG